MSDILGQALYGYFKERSRHKLWINNRYGEPEEMPVKTYFRKEDDMPDLEWLALKECRGKVLDIGAGAGSHTLYLQEQDCDVTAIDISPLSVEIMKDRGVVKAITGDIFSYHDEKFDTLLLMMNGIGLAGTLYHLKQLLNHFKELLKPGGQILFDSSDIAYLYEDNLPQDRYHGEVWYQYEYKGEISDWFQWLYIDEGTMRGLAEETGFEMDVLLEDEFGQYLSRLTIR